MKHSLLSKLLILPLCSFASCEKEISVSKPEDPPQNSGRIFVASIPAGASVFLNNKNTGYVTPDTVPYLNAGNYLLTLKLKYYKDSSEIVLIQKDSTSSAYFDFVNNPTMRGELYVDSNPRNVSIFLNDSLISIIAPVTFALLLSSC